MKPQIMHLSTMTFIFESLRGAGQKKLTFLTDKSIIVLGGGGINSLVKLSTPTILFNQL